MSLVHKKQKAIELRKNGFSYGQILKELNLSSKGTLSTWFKDLSLSDEIKRKLKKNYETATKRGLHKFNKERSERINDENNKFFNEGKNLIQISNKKELLITGATLYWGEGTKYEKGSPSLIFTNSDPDMISLYIRFLREGLNVDEHKIKAGIHLHPYVDENDARKYWSNVTGLPSDLFYIVNVKNIASKGVRNKRKLSYGMAIIKVHKRQIFYLVKGMIESLKS